MLDRIRHEVRVRLIRVVDEVVERHERAAAEVSERHHRTATELAERHHREQLDAVRHEVDRAIDAFRATVHEFEVRSRRDILAAGERAAVASSARFVREGMVSARTFPHPGATLEHALSLAPADGLALEFGVYGGHTLKITAAARGGREVYGFDSFQGLPEPWRAGFPAGTFDDVDAVPDVPGAELVVGWFADTLPGFLDAHPGPVAFLHLDADLYSSTRTVLELVGPRLAPGSVVLFDEYFNYPGWEQHEHRAWQEYVERTGTEFSYEGYTLDNEQVIVRVTALDGPEAAPR